MTSSASSPRSDSDAGVVFTPAGSASPLPPTSGSPQTSSKGIRLVHFPKDKKEPKSARRKEEQTEEYKDEQSGDESDTSDMGGRPPYHRPTGGLSEQPLLKEGKHTRGRSDDSAGSEFASRRAEFRSRSPKFSNPEEATRKKYIYASFFLLVSLVSFVVQTETSVYIQHTLKWNKAYCMLWLTHGSWSTLWPTQLLILRIQNRKLSWPAFWRKHTTLLRSTAQMVQSQDLHLSPQTTSRDPWRYMLMTTAGVTTFLTIAGGSWYVAVNMTTPSDLTAIYNCSAFFAYVFSILLLGDKVRLDKVLSVGLAVLGVLVVAYGDSGNPKHGSHSGGATNPNHDGETDNRTLGNLIIGIGSVLYGLYEVLYKKYACPPEGTSPGRGMIFANTFGTMIGMFTTCILWIPIPILHFTGIEPFEMPRGKTAALLAVSTLSNATFSGAFLVLMSLTSPVLSSVAALLTIFLVAIVDYMLTGEPMSGATISGGILIVVAFGLLSWATYREMMEEERKRESDENKPFDIDDEDGDFAIDDRDYEADETDELGRKGRKSRESS